MLLSRHDKHMQGQGNDMNIGSFDSRNYLFGCHNINNLWHCVKSTSFSLKLKLLMTAVSVSKRKHEAIGQSSQQHVLIIFVACICFWTVN